MRIALFEPDIATNTGTIIRLGACMAVAIDIIEPCGFPFGDAALRRAGLDYLPKADINRHKSWDAFRSSLNDRLILATTKASATHTAFRFLPTDTILFGRETAGVPENVAASIQHKIRIPIAHGFRSLNVAVAAAIIIGEALRQTETYPK